MATKRHVSKHGERQEPVVEAKEKNDKQEEENRTAILMTFVVVSIDTILMFMYIAYMPALYNMYGLDNLTFGYIQSTFALIQLCVTPLLGTLADMIGPRQVLIMCLASCTFANLSLGLATSASMLIMSRIISTIMDAGTVCQMVLMHLVPESARSRYLARSALPLAIGMIISPTIGGALAKRLGPQRPLFLGFGLGVISIILALVFIPKNTMKKASNEKKEKSTDWRSGIGHYLSVISKWPAPFLLGQLLLTFLPAITFMMNVAIAGATHFKLDPQTNGLIMSCFGMMLMVNNAIVIPYTTSKFDEDLMMKVAPILVTFAFFLLTQAESAIGLLIPMYPLSLGFGICDNIATVKLTKAVNPSDTSMILSVVQMIRHLGRTLAPSIGGMLFHYYGWTSIGSFGIACGVLSTTLTFMYV